MVKKILNTKNTGINNKIEKSIKTNINELLLYILTTISKGARFVFNKMKKFNIFIFIKGYRMVTAMFSFKTRFACRFPHIINRLYLFRTLFEIPIFCRHLFYKKVPAPSSVVKKVSAPSFVGQKSLCPLIYFVKKVFAPPFLFGEKSLRSIFFYNKKSFRPVIFRGKKVTAPKRDHFFIKKGTFRDQILQKMGP